MMSVEAVHCSVSTCTFSPPFGLSFPYSEEKKKKTFLHFFFFFYFINPAIVGGGL